MDRRKEAHLFDVQPASYQGCSACLGGARLALWAVLLVGAASAVRGLTADDRRLDDARADLRRLQEVLPDWHIVRVHPGTRELKVEKGNTLTVENLRGVDIDPHPPALSERTVTYDPRQSDGYAPGEAPYVAEGIGPFRFRFFNCEFNYGGWHNFDMQDYAATHGFNIIYPYTRTVAETRHWPEGTQILNWGGFVNWHKWFAAHDLPDGRYDLLADMDLVEKHLAEARFKRDPRSDQAKMQGDLLMIDQEHSVLPPEKLRKQPWFPAAEDDATQRQFQQRYYDGYAKTYISSVRAARQQGWENISIYGWYPYGRTWGGLEDADPDPGTDIAWNAFGEAILRTVDIVNNSVYCFYWTPKNVAYTLANLDLNLRMVRSADASKPVRPYYWTLLHGGGGGWRWWRGQPLPDEEERAMMAMAFFTGADGFDTWNWSGTGSHHTVTLRSRRKEATADDPQWTYHDVMVGHAFSLSAADGTEETLQRYDVLHITGVSDDGMISFQKIRPGKTNHGVDSAFPEFSLSRAELMPHLRAKSEPVRAMIEGMALVKPFEALLAHGRVHVDVSAQEQFEKTLPLVRRVQLGPYHVMVTYDPAVIHGGAPRPVRLHDAPGLEGVTVTLPADEQTRIVVLEMVEQP